MKELNWGSLTNKEFCIYNTLYALLLMIERNELKNKKELRNELIEGFISEFIIFIQKNSIPVFENTNEFIDSGTFFIKFIEKKFPNFCLEYKEVITLIKERRTQWSSMCKI